jgi:hypothetical protein
MPENIRFSNPDTMQKPPGYSHVVEVTGPGRTVYFAGQLGIDKSGKMGANAREQMESRLKHEGVDWEWHLGSLATQLRLCAPNVTPGRYGSVGGLLVVLTTSTIGCFINRRKASVSKQPVGEPRTKPIDALANVKTAERRNICFVARDCYL